MRQYMYIYIYIYVCIFQWSVKRLWRHFRSHAMQNNCLGRRVHWTLGRNNQQCTMSVLDKHSEWEFPYSHFSSVRYDIYFSQWIRKLCSSNLILIFARTRRRYLDFGQLAWATFATTIPPDFKLTFPWWRHQMETFSDLLALCDGNPPVTGGFSSQRPVTRPWWFLWSVPE